MNSPADLARRIDNLIRPGSIAAVDHARALCRVQCGALLTDWLPWCERRAGTTRTWNPPAPGEQVLLLCPSGDMGAGFVLTGIYTAAHDQPSSSATEHVVDFPDGARIAYDHTSGTLTLSGLRAIRIDGGEVIHVGGDLQSNGVILHTHRHTGVQSGGSITGEPQR
ncbi:phage baseplate assembly protein V [Thauera butanivorans]|uniref:phage baseplate assembly protein V n=1 Tax=Thauera butanivorans TaxID=86174 RepID=UPI000837ED09|nr:phage baseplate assembly protein V [Thauera butanivorans]